MGRRAEVALYRMFVIAGTHRYVRIVRSGRSWAPKIQPVGKPGAYYLRKAKAAEPDSSGKYRRSVHAPFSETKVVA
jgi:hypothetical protein